MLESIVYTFPGAGAEECAAFAALGSLFGQTGNLIRVSAAKGFTPDTVFCLDPGISSACVDLRTDWQCFTLSAPDFHPHDPRPSRALPFAEAARRLVGKIERLDHSGFLVPDTIGAQAWGETLDFLAANAVVRDYPREDGYDPKRMRWNFVEPAADLEHDIRPTSGRRGPMMELVYEPGIALPVMQLDFHTKLTRKEIAALYPESFTLPGLGQFFCSVDVASPWHGMPNMRFDLRGPGPQPEISPQYDSACYSVEKGPRIRPNTPAARLPVRAARAG